MLKKINKPICKETRTKNLLIAIFAILCLLTSLTGCSKPKIEKPKVTTLTEYPGVVDDSKVVEITIDDALSFFKDGKTGMLLFSRPTCPWCQKALPVLAEVAKEKQFDVYYVDTEKFENWAESKTELVGYTEEFLSRDHSIDSEGQLTIYIPFVVAVKDGKATDAHIGTVDTDQDYETPMTSEQIEMLREVYIKMAYEGKLY